jgi:hypothetical protein
MVDPAILASPLTDSRSSACKVNLYPALTPETDGNWMLATSKNTLDLAGMLLLAKC